MTTEDVRNETLQEEVTPETQNPGGEKMGEQERQGHQENGKPAGEGNANTRKPYNGSKWHGVSSKMEKLENIGMATKALERLEKRFDYLVKELRVTAAIINDSSLSYGKRDKAYEKEDKIKLQIKAVLKLKGEIEEVTPNLEKAVKGKIDSYDSSYIDSYKF